MRQHWFKSCSLNNFCSPGSHITRAVALTDQRLEKPAGSCRRCRGYQQSRCCSRCTRAPATSSSIPSWATNGAYLFPHASSSLLAKSCKRRRDRKLKVELRVAVSVRTPFSRRARPRRARELLSECRGLGSFSWSAARRAPSAGSGAGPPRASAPRGPHGGPRRVRGLGAREHFLEECRRPPSGHALRGSATDAPTQASARARPRRRRAQDPHGERAPRPHHRRHARPAGGTRPHDRVALGAEDGAVPVRGVYSWRGVQVKSKAPSDCSALSPV